MGRLVRRLISTFYHSTNRDNPNYSPPHRLFEMLELFQTVFLLLVALVTWTYIRVAKGISYPGDVPRFGEPGVWGYLTTAFRYTFDAESVISEGRAKYSGQPFAVPTLVSSFVFES